MVVVFSSDGHVRYGWNDAVVPACFNLGSCEPGLTGVDAHQHHHLSQSSRLACPLTRGRGVGGSLVGTAGVLHTSVTREIEHELAELRCFSNGCLVRILVKRSRAHERRR